MSLSALKTWVSGEVLTASDLNSEFAHIYNNTASLFSPVVANLDLDGYTLIMDSDGDSSIKVSTNNRLDLTLGGVLLFKWDGTVASPVNGLTMTATATGSGPTIAATGSDTNIPVTLAGKGTGKVAIGQATSTGAQLVADQPILDSSGNEFAKFSKAATAVNELTIGNAATGNAPALTATGDDSNIGVTITPKGTGTITLAGPVAISGASTLSGTLGMSGMAINEAQGSDVASSGTIDLDAATGNLVDVTGTTGITAITLSQGRERTVRFTGALTLTNGASLVLPGGANITTAAGDFAIFRGYAAGVVRCVVYSPLSGPPIASSQTQMEAASSNAVFVTPGAINWHPGVAKFWLKANISGSLIASRNITSITDTGTGILDITIATDFSGNDYCALASIEGLNYCVSVESMLAGTLRVKCWNGNTAAAQDPTMYYVVGYGDQ